MILLPFLLNECECLPFQTFYKERNKERNKEWNKEQKEGAHQ